MAKTTSQDSESSDQGTAAPACVYSAGCPSRRVLELVADKWTLLILPALFRGPRRNSELLRQIEGISQKMLTQTLRSLERSGLIVRRDFGEVPPRVDYQLTDLGCSLCRAIQRLDDWAEANYAAVERSRAAFDRERASDTD